ncbi:MAG: BamA/TamA family outer membrane protein [Spirochaetales bacterium]|nr:BamA/TamA family outer membrane protein [Spirochaetales bacterium]
MSSFIAALLILVSAPTISRLSATEPETPQVGEIRLEGLRRTREEIVYDLIPAEPGDPFSTELLEEIRVALVDSELFASIDVSADGAEASAETVDVVVVLDERWTLVPIPFFSTGGGATRGGLILLESNLFGRNKQLISAGFIGTNGASGFFGYIDPAVFQSKWTTSVSANIGTSEEERLLPDETTLREYEIDSRGFGLSVGYNFTDDIAAQIGLDYGAWDIGRDEPTVDIDALDDEDFLQSGAEIEWDATRPIDVLRVGPRAEIDGRLATLDSSWEVAGTLDWAFPVVRTHRVRLLASGGYGDTAFLVEEIISDADGYRTLPFQTISADRWGSVSAFYDFPVLSQEWGALVLTHFWEAGMYDTDYIDTQNFYGFGGGFRVFIRQVAIPALGLNVGYNIEEGVTAFSFTLGAQM